MEGIGEQAAMTGRSTVRTLYHVASSAYRDGDALLCRSHLRSRGIEVEWKFGGTPECDDDLVSLHDSLTLAAEWMSAYQPGGRILRVSLADDAALVQDSDGALAMRERIESSCIAAALTKAERDTIRDSVRAFLDRRALLHSQRGEKT